LDLKGRSVPESLTLGLGHLLRWLLLLLPCLILDWLVLRKVRAALGGCLRCTISGGGALPESIDRFLNDAGIPVLEGYGLTETSPVLAVRREDKVVIGTVGAPYPGTELRIVDPASRKVLYPDPSRPDGGRGLRGEIEARGPQVMLGYHRQPEATAAVLSDGWFRTGDLGLFTFNDCLRIVGRIKETIVLTSGENVEPGPIEGRLVQSPLILQAMVVGQDAKALTALLVPNLEGLRAAGLAASNLAELAGNPRVPGMLEAEVRRLVNRESGFKPQELIHDCVVLPKAFEVGDELTATYKLRRHVITAKYAPGPRD
jgi:long-chain acyl-CoA synthetase